MKSALSSRKPEVGTVSLLTKQGDTYTFPAMDKKALEKVVPRGSNQLPPGTPVLTMVNASLSVLSVSFKVIDRILVDEEEWWGCHV